MKLCKPVLSEKFFTNFMNDTDLLENRLSNKNQVAKISTGRL